MINRIKHYFALRKARKRAVLLGRLIDSVDKALDKKEIPNWKRRQFWRDFIESAENRKKFIEEMRINGA